MHIAAQSTRYGTAFISDSDKDTIRDELLRTIHCPRNLSQLSQILPKSKYASGTSGSG